MDILNLLKFMANSVECHPFYSETLNILINLFNRFLHNCESFLDEMLPTVHGGGWGFAA